MTDLSSLKDTTRPVQGRKRIGRGPGSGMGKTSCRGQKGAGARSGYKRRLTYEGGQFRLFQKLPQKGFSNARFRRRLDSVNLQEIDRVFADGEMVNLENLRKHGLISGKSWGIKVLGMGSLTKKLAGFEVNAVSVSAKAAIEKAGISLDLNTGVRKRR